MVMMLSQLPIAPEEDIGPDAWRSLDEEKRTRLAIIAEDMIAALAPLTQIRSREALEDLLQARVSRFLQLKLELIQLLWGSLTNATRVAGSFDQMRQVVLAKSDLLGEDLLQRLLGTLESSEAFRNWGFEGIGAGGMEAYRVSVVLEQVGGVTPLGDMCVNALMGILTDRITDWQPEAIPILAAAADDYMAEVEDAFLAQTAGVNEDDPEGTIDYESLRKEIGL